jgi:multidrug efflux pump subunit AcrB
MKTEKLSWYTKLSLGFIQRYRITILIILVVLSVGFFSYNVFLRKEGYPEIQYPGVIISTTYVVNDAEKVSKDITEPVTKAINGIDQVKKVTTTSGDNYAVIFVQLDDNASSQDKLKELREAIGLNVKMPSDQIKLNYSTIKASSWDGKYDFIMTLSSNDKSYYELQQKAEDLVSKLSTVEGVKEAGVKKAITQQMNPLTGKEVEYQSNFGSVGYKKDGQLVFERAIEIGLVVDGQKIGSIELSDNIKKAVETFNSEKGLSGYSVNYGGDNATVVKAQLGSLQDNTIGGIIAILFVLALLINWRASLVTALFIPTTLAATFITFYLIGYSLNTISMFGLILVLGLFVDDATVIVEAIDYQKKQGLKGIKAVERAVQTVGSADIVGTLCTLLVFVPMLFITGIMGKFIVYMPITVILALALSLTIAITLMPFLTNLFIRDEKESKPSILKSISDVLYIIPRNILKLGEVVSRFVNAYLSKKLYTALVIIVTFALIAVGIFYAQKLPFSVFPSGKDSDSALLSVQFTNAPTIDNAEKTLTVINNKIKQDYGKYIESITYISPDNQSATAMISFVPMKSRDIKASKLLDDMNKDFETTQNAKLKFTMVSAGPTTGEYPFTMQIFSADRNKATELAKKISAFINGREVVSGIKVTDVHFDQDTTILTTDGKRYINLKCKFEGSYDTNTILQLQKQIEEEFKADKDLLGFDFGMESETLSSFYSTIFAFIAAIVILYAVLVLKFNSFSQPLLIFISIPLSFPLVFPGLYYTGNYLSFFVMIGLIGLVGIVVNNTIMLVDFANHGREAGLSIKDAIVRAVKLRFRPLVTTSITTIASLTPLALQDPVWESLALTIIFGLISSTILVIFIFPAFYAIVEKMREYKSRLAHKLFK